MPVVNANSVDPDQTPHSAFSDLGIHCLLGTNGLREIYAIKNGLLEVKTKSAQSDKSSHLAPCG